MKKLFLFLFILIFTSYSCGSRKDTSNNSNEKSRTMKSQTFNDSIHIQIYVEASGVITANGKKTNVNDLDNRLFDLSKKNGAVWYSRENVSGDPSKESMQVMDLVIKYRLPIKFFMDKDFQKVYIPN